MLVLKNMKCLKRLFCTRRRKHRSGVYILQLEKGKFYVGQSDDIDRRIWLHTNHNGSAWTKKYNVVERLPLLTSYQPYFWELTETLEMMKEHGVENVRGSMFTSPFELKPFEKVDLATKSEPLTCSIRCVSSRDYDCCARGLFRLSYLIEIGKNLS